jgi:hypothetical protein
VQAGSRASERIELALSIILLACFVAYFGLYGFRMLWVADLRMYCAGVAELERSLLHPMHEATDAPAATTGIYTPFIVAIGVLGKIISVTPYRALQIAGVINLIFYASAMVFFFRSCSPEPRRWSTPAFFLIASLFLRMRSFGWSSETDLLAFRYVQAYPSTFAWSLALFAFGAANRSLEGGPKRWAIIAFAAMALATTSHLLTATWMAGVIGLMIALRLARSDRRSALRPAGLLAAAVGLGVLLSFAWPGFEIPLGIYAGVAENPPFGRTPFADMANLYWLALAAVPWLALRRTGWSLLAGFAATHLVLVIARGLHVDFGHRYAFFEAFFAQVAVAQVCAIGLASLLEGRWRSLGSPREALTHWAPIAFLVATISTALFSSETAQLRGASGAMLSPSALLEQPPSHDRYYALLGNIASHLSRGDRLMMHLERDAWDIASITGARAILSPYAFRVPDYAERVEDIERFFATSTSTIEAQEILERRRVTKILLTERHLDLAPAMERRYGPPAAVDPRFILFDARGTGPGL